jgi:PBP1b-binding outer membrane lipoprotein LpoB
MKKVFAILAVAAMFAVACTPKPVVEPQDENVVTTQDDSETEEAPAEEIIVAE